MAHLNEESEQDFWKNSKTIQQKMERSPHKPWHQRYNETDTPGFELILRYDCLRFWYTDEFQDWALTAFILLLVFNLLTLRS